MAIALSNIVIMTNTRDGDCATPHEESPQMQHVYNTAYNDIKDQLVQE